MKPLLHNRREFLVEAISAVEARWGLDRAISPVIPRHQALCFHRVENSPNPFWPGIRPNDLDWLLTELRRRRFTPVSISEAVAKRPSSKAKTVALTFDDGYADFAETALPVLEAHSAPSCLSLIGNCLETGEAPVGARVFESLRTASPERIAEVRRLVGAPPGMPMYRLGAHVEEVARNQPVTLEAQRIKEDLVSILFGSGEGAHVPVLTASQVAKLPSSVEFAIHGQSHRRYSAEEHGDFLADAHKAMSTVTAALGFTPNIFAFPFGHATPDQHRAIRELGFEYQLVVRGEAYVPSRDVLARTIVGARSRGHLLLEALNYRNWSFSGDRSAP